MVIMKVLIMMMVKTGPRRSGDGLSSVQGALRTSTTTGHS